MIKKNFKLFIGIIIGGIIFGSIGVYAASKIYAQNVSVDTTNMSELGASSDVNAALDYLYGKASSVGLPSGVNMADETIYYTYAGGYWGGITDVTTNYMDLVNAGKKYFVMENESTFAGCVYYNNKLYCFDAQRFVSDIRYAKQVFGASNCSYGTNNIDITCSGTGFYIYVKWHGTSPYIAVGTASNNYCQLSSIGIVSGCRY